MPEVLIRPESADDVGAIREVNIEAFRVHPFSRQTEHLIVETLRAADALDVSLVAVYQGRVVGHIAFSDAAVGESATGWSLMGPVAVLPDIQNEGMGSALVRAGLDKLRVRGSMGCVLVGDPAFYGRFGFRTYPGLTHDGVPDEYVLALPFANVTPLGPIRGHAAFEVEPSLESGRA